MTSSRIPAGDPGLVVPEAWLAPNPAAAGPDRNLQANSLLVRGGEPLVVDTRVAVHRRRWLELVSSLVDPEDVRWIVLSQDSFLAGDRRMRLVLPPIFDGPTTRGLLEEPTDVAWCVDPFAAPPPGPCTIVTTSPTTSTRSRSRCPTASSRRGNRGWTRRARSATPSSGPCARDELIATTVVGHAVV